MRLSAVIVLLSAAVIFAGGFKVRGALGSGK